jgi:hypothetical protein
MLFYVLGKNLCPKVRSKMPSSQVIFVIAVYDFIPASRAALYLANYNSFVVFLFLLPASKSDTKTPSILH